MIKHHPNKELLQAFACGDLPASMSAAIAMHNEMCPNCQGAVTSITEQHAECSFELTDSNVIADGFANSDHASMLGFDMDAMIDSITTDSRVDSIAIRKPVTATVNGKIYQLPRALQSMDINRWISIGKLSRARVELNEGEVHSSLLHIEPGGTVPEHTHNGYEVTLLLDGSFSDDMGEYSKGDFIVLDGSHKHQPVTKEGCLCFTVANDALHFTQGLNKLLNPFGNLIY
ncbi:ChrR family anti-sigma-E factor [Thalassotalea maritima]|uniref:ChrR family anti-sigma-E factor n=1 Tax=Thalassotalea maritima TaxID=3242416 RepID=UPI003527BF2F